MTLSDRNSHSSSLFSLRHFTLQGRDDLSGADSVSTRTVMYGFQLMTSESEVQGDFPQAVLTESVTRAEFLTSLFFLAKPLDLRRLLFLLSFLSDLPFGA